MFYIIENQKKDDGTINTSTVGRQNINSALSYFWERCSKMSMTELYTSVAIGLYDETLKEIDRKIVTTMYPQPVEATEE